MAALAVIAKIAMVAGTVMSTAGQMKQAQDTKNIANVNAANTRNVAAYNAGLANQAAGQEEAASQIRANEVRRQSRLKQSRVLALAAASGGGAMDMDVMNAIAGFEEEGDLAARVELYQGSESARKYRAQGEAGVWQGEIAARNLKYEGLSKASALKNKAIGTIMGGASSLASKYGGRGFGSSSPGYSHSPSGRY